MTRELDEACARVLGLTIRDVEWLQTHRVYEAPSGTHWTDDAIDRLSGGASIPAFSTDPAAVRLLEDEIERRELWQNYVQCLAYDIDAPPLSTVSPDVYPAYRVWRLIRATPEQRARAFIASTQLP